MPITSAVAPTSVVMISKWRVRLLPITLVVVTVLLIFKVNTLWHSITIPRVKDSYETSNNVDGTAVAQTTTPNGSATTSPAQPSLDSRLTANLREDSAEFSKSEIALLQILSGRRKQLDSRERDIEARENILKAAEKHLAEKALALDAVKAELIRLVDRRSKKEDERLASLVKIYEAMKPVEAAPILAQLDTSVVIGVIERMKEAKVAPILAAMPPDRAKSLTIMLADRKDSSSRDIK